MRGPLLVVMTLAVLWAPRASAQTEEREALRRRLAADRVRVQFLTNEEASVLAGLEALEKGIRDKQKRVAELGDEIVTLDKRVAELTDRIVQNQARLGDLRERFGKRAAAMLRLRRARLTRLLRRIADPNEVRRSRDRFDFVKGFDLALIRGMLDATAADRKLRFELTEKKAAAEETRVSLETAVEEARDLSAEREALLVAIRKERVGAARLARELKDAAKRLDAYMGRVLGSGPQPEPLAGGFAAQRGHLPWPVVGRLEVPFGKKVDPESDMVLISKGIDIRAAQSSPVRAVFEGKVAFAGSREGFGNVLVLEHGGYYSLYAHLESFAVQVGQAVLPQQLVGYVGDSGSTKGAYLYFELRQGRAPVDPMHWLAP
ncbi:MAG: peptidoglycan DD-metalloendopeptidase family protein [Deltaproteobacteria bacterium]|nr:peptidoglycan DD-metalloendopeptidase family protein [Deltaproteobacteria bacterium]